MPGIERKEKKIKIGDAAFVRPRDESDQFSSAALNRDVHFMEPGKRKEREREREKGRKSTVEGKEKKKRKIIANEATGITELGVRKNRAIPLLCPTGRCSFLHRGIVHNPRLSSEALPRLFSPIANCAIGLHFARRQTRQTRRIKSCREHLSIRLEFR